MEDGLIWGFKGAMSPLKSKDVFISVKTQA